MTQIDRISTSRIPTSRVPTSAARSLCRTLRLLRTETAARVLDGTLAVSAGDLLGAASSVSVWLEDLVAATVTADGDHIALPRRERWELQHIAYTISAVLVWADTMRQDGRLTTTVPREALEAWAHVEGLAGLPGRTAIALSAMDVDVQVHTVLPDLAPARG